METITYSEARGNFRATIEKVCEDHTPVIITRRNQQPVVMVSLEDYNAMEETLYLLRNPRNAERLLQSVHNIQAGQVQEKSLLET